MPWNSRERNITRLGIGATAKWTLAAYAERHRDLLDFYRSQRDYQPERIAFQLDDVIEAAETFESDRIRKQELAAIDDAKIQEMREEGQPSAARFSRIGCDRDWLCRRQRRRLRGARYSLHHHRRAL